MENINFFFEEVEATIAHQEELIRWIERSIFSHNRGLGNINYIFCNDAYLHKINIAYLQHDTLTDIITFDQSDSSDTIDGDLFISLERVEENAKNLKTSFADELHRVMIHGILHLIGFNDKSNEQKEKMRELENALLFERDF